MDVIEKESLLLYDICCGIGISSSQWKRNIQLVDYKTTMASILLTNDFITTGIVCGSQSEGIRIFSMISSKLGMSSDVDLMCTFGCINVQEHEDTKNTNQTEVLQLLSTDSPEHVLLKVKSSKSACETFNNTSLSWIPQVLKRKQSKYLVSSSLLQDYNQGLFAKKASLFPSIQECSIRNVRDVAFQVNPPFKNTTIHGPAIMTEDKSPLHRNFDIVYCIRCYQWHTAAHEWIDRARSHGWPSQDLIDQIMNDGCEVVAVGRKHHPDGDEEWKLSFSRAETRLIRNFSIYQAQCYQLLKIVKSCFISSVVADSLSSYHIKTVMLHTVEQTDPEVWRKENLAQCFMMCLSNLKGYLTDKSLPQYFIVRQNLLEPKVTGNVHQKVLEIVTNLDKIGWKCILQCPVLQTLCRSIQETVGSIPYNVITDFYALEGNKQLIGDFCSTLHLYVLTQVDSVSYSCYLLNIVGLCEKTFLKPTTILLSVETATVIQLLRKSELGLLLTVIRAMAHPDLRPGIEPLMNFAQQYLEESCHADVSSCRLKFATFFFHLGEYDQCIATVQDVIGRFKDVWVVGGGMYRIVHDIEIMNSTKLEFQLNRVLQLSDNGFPFLSNHLSLPVIFIRWEIAVAPEGVHYLYEKKPIGNVCCIDAFVYAHYLLVESYLKVNEYDLAEHALLAMKECIRNGNDDMFDRNYLCFCQEDNLLLHYSEMLMKDK